MERLNVLSGIFRQLTEATNALQALADTVDGYALRDHLLAVVAQLDDMLDFILDAQHAAKPAAARKEHERCV